MKRNLLELYDLVSDHILAYGYFKPQIFSKEFASPRLFFTRRKELLSGTFSERRPEEFREHFNYMATKKQRESKYFGVYQSEYPLDALCEQIEMHFPNIDFKALATLNKLKKKHLSDSRTFKFKEKFGIVLGAATIFLKEVPKSVVEKLFNYDSYQIWIFYIMIGVLAYLSIVFLFVRRMLGTPLDDLKRLNYIEHVLEYGSLRIDQELTPQECFIKQEQMCRQYLNKTTLNISGLKDTLDELGYFQGPINDEFTPQLVDALMTLQRRNGIEPVDGIFGFVIFEKIAELMNLRARSNNAKGTKGP